MPLVVPPEPLVVPLAPVPVDAALVPPLVVAAPWLLPVLAAPWALVVELLVELVAVLPVVTPAEVVPILVALVVALCSTRQVPAALQVSPAQQRSSAQLAPTETHAELVVVPPPPLLQAETEQIKTTEKNDPLNAAFDMESPPGGRALLTPPLSEQGEIKTGW